MTTLRLALATTVIAACAFAQDVQYNFDQQADFSAYKTYRWEKHPQTVELDDLTLSQLGAAFDAELAKKGLAKKGSGDTDLVIVYQLAVSQEKEITSYNTGWGYGPGWGAGWYGGGGGMTTSTSSTINIGAVALDMYDAAKKHLVWRGTATKTIDANAKPEKRQKNMQKAAAKMLKNYPPKKKK